MLTRYRPDGSIIASIADWGMRGAIAFTPDARSAVVISPGYLVTYDLSSGITSKTYVSGVAFVTRVVFYGGWTAAQGFADFAEVPVAEMPVLLVLIAILAAVALARLR